MSSSPLIWPEPLFLDQPATILAAYFQQLPAATISQLHGQVWQGRLYAPIMTEQLPITVRRVLNRLLQTAMNPWRGKTFTTTQGKNVWWFGQHFASYRLSEQTSPVDQHLCLWLDYDVADNPRFLRAIRGEVRQIDSQTFLARMNWKAADHYYTVAFFTLRQPTPADGAT